MHEFNIIVRVSRISVSYCKLLLQQHLLLVDLLALFFVKIFSVLSLFTSISNAFITLFHNKYVNTSLEI